MTASSTCRAKKPLLVWTAQRCLTSLRAIYDAVSRCAPVDQFRFWGLVGESILGAAGICPHLGRRGANQPLSAAGRGCWTLLSPQGCPCVHAARSRCVLVGTSSTKGLLN